MIISTTSSTIKLNTIVNYQFPVSVLVEQTQQRKEGTLNNTGALVIHTGEFTGRSPADKFIVRDQITENIVDWNKFNNPISDSAFQQLREEMITYLDSQPKIWVRDAYACSDPKFRINLRFLNEMPSSNLFVANMFLSPSNSELEDFKHDWLVIQAPGFNANPAKHETRRGNFTIISFTHQTILIGGSGYTGEIKKSIFTLLNFILPLKHRVLSMHCSANEGPAGDTALFFGLSGTGKTTLSSDPARVLIGDDEHGWSDKGVFNFEGGCYAKVVNLSEEQEPDIFRAIRTGALVENTKFLSKSNRIDFNNQSITENTRASYPLHFIANTKSPALSGIPKNIFFLTCDAYGVFPPISKLDHDQAMYYFINGYTAKIAGTEAGIKEPQVTFSACFGAPFLPLPPSFYASLLKEKLEKYGTQVWMINTGWTGGSYGKGKRISLAYTRAMINAALNNKLANVYFYQHAIFGVSIPENCPGVPTDILDPENTWPNKLEYKITATNLVENFFNNAEAMNI